MNVTHVNEQAISFTIWERPAMRRALAERDMAAVYLMLQRNGVSQRRLAALTGQSQSEISEILNGRQVMAYDVLVRIADGLGVPRGYMGLAYDEGPGFAGHESDAAGEADDDERVRRLLAHAAQVTIGAVTPETTDWPRPLARSATPVPARIGEAEVEQVETVTETLRALDYRYGGGTCRDAVVAQLAWSQSLLRAGSSEQVRHRLHRALADQHNLAGWTSFDTGLYDDACRHFTRALEQAKYAGDPSLAANVLYRLGRVHLHRHRVVDALRFFQLGQICAQDASCELTVALLCANEAWAYALLGDERLALKSMRRAEDEFARSDRAAAPAWVRFFSEADLHAAGGMCHAGLSDTLDHHLDPAAELLLRSVAGRDQDMARSKVFELIALATVRLRLGDIEGGLRDGHEAVTLTARIRSARALHRMDPLDKAAAALGARTDARELRRRIADLRAQ
ncbi:helix-turn-helix transcriptional regulator [Sphaerisporangium rubeum]|uniref:Transcriptional regulator with XRE-family HTH domain n=1 Tax=Sphaerisporangium rubeum TaxID=321317 RepID=A0A7X0IFU4_9ACTN|nr:helix-turn-helix transcriptional regulator [Sphaerisporangium rubeum]MBB6474250.1 transcriptional regulator with XRE-family HTH domain [Sphaerisporangium rubeum]